MFNVGRVFSPEEIRLRQVPRLESFGVMVEEIRREISESPVSAAIVCGSVTNGTHTVRSDIDCVVIFPWKYSKTVTELTQRLSQKASSMFVPLEFIPVVEELATEGIHTIDPSFHRHLLRSADLGGLIKGRPFEAIPLDGQDDRASIMAYMTRKPMNLRKRMAKEDADVPDVDFISKMLDAPVNSARKALAYRGVLPEDDTKESVKYVFAEEFPGLFPQLGACMLRDRQYSGWLRELLAADYDEEFCLRALRALRNDFGMFIGFLEDLSLALVSGSNGLT